MSKIPSRATPPCLPLLILCLDNLLCHLVSHPCHHYSLITCLFLCYTIFTLFLRLHSSSFFSASHRSPSLSKQHQLLGSSLFQVTIFLFLQTDNPFRLLPTPTAPEIKGFPHWINPSHLKPYIPATQENSPSYILTTTGPYLVKFQ